MNAEAIQRVFDEAVAAGNVAGVVGAVTSGTETLFEGGAGVTAMGGDQPVGPDSLFWIASMTKPITSIAAMQLVEQGKLSLDAPIGDLLPQLASRQILEGGVLRPAAGKMTLRHLLTHTSGFSYGFSSAEYAAYIKTHHLEQSPGMLATLDMPLLFEPGTKWEYGISTDWVGLAVEAASGERLDAYFLKHIFAPLGMNDTMFLPDALQTARRVALHQRQADGTLLALPIVQKSQVPQFFSGGGGLYSTLADYLKFLRMFLSGGAGIVTAATLAEMSRNQVGGLRAGYIPSANPALTTGGDPTPGQDNRWGLGFLIYSENGPFGRHSGSLSWGGLANTAFWIDPAVNLAAVILMQTLPYGDPGAAKTMIGFERAVYAAPR
jgi:CubicO group peptidase (beta-lactamase class C family)